MADATRHVRLKVAAYRNYTFELPGRPGKSATEHCRIAERIEHDDPDVVARLMREHIDIRREDYAPFIALFERAQQA